VTGKGTKKPPEHNAKGRTGRFVPCPAERWRHPEDRVAFEVRWSAKRKSGLIQVYHFYACSVCEPKTQVFLNDWNEGDGFTVVEAEAAGYRPKVTKERKAELLQELGLKQVQQPWPPHQPPPPGFPPPAYMPAPPRKRKPPKK
jgi:hypothetical protein